MPCVKVFEDNKTLAFMDVMPESEGHVLVVPKEGAQDILDLSGDGLAADLDAAIAHGHALLEAGADLLDVGAESTRPGSAPVPPEEERRRLLPVVQDLAKAATVSVDTRNAATMTACLEAGAEIVNDITALRHDRDALRVVTQARAPVVLMHMLGMDPRTMQQNPQYADVALDVARFLRDRVETLERLGIPRGRIAVDPGIGFGKTVAHNLTLLDRCWPGSAAASWSVPRARASSAGSAERPPPAGAPPAALPLRWPPRCAAPASCACTTWPRRCRR